MSKLSVRYLAGVFVSIKGGVECNWPSGPALLRLKSKTTKRRLKCKLCAKDLVKTP